MPINDHISNMLTRIRNAQNARHDQVEFPSSRIVASVAQILREEGYVRGVRVVTEGGRTRLRVYLKPDPAGGYAIKGLRRVSRPGRRVYVGKDEVPTVKNGFGIAILSTSRGVMTGEKARQLAIGGELLCEVW